MAIFRFIYIRTMSPCQSLDEPVKWTLEMAGTRGTGGIFPPSSSSLNRTAAVFHPDAFVSLDVPLEIIQRRTHTNVCHRPLECPLPKERTARFRHSNPSAGRWNSGRILLSRIVQINVSLCLLVSAVKCNKSGLRVQTNIADSHGRWA